MTTEPDLRDAELLMRVPSAAREEARLALIELEALENNPTPTQADGLRAIELTTIAIKALLDATEEPKP